MKVIFSNWCEHIFQLFPDNKSMWEDTSPDWYYCKERYGPHNEELKSAYI